MNLKEYMEITNKNVINFVDMQLFNIPNLEKGWKKRYKNNEAEDNLVYEVINKMHGKPLKRMMLRIKDSVRDKQVEINSPLRSKGKVLYLMINSIGMLKIGVSQDAQERARQLSNGAGVYISVIGIWETDDAFACEKFLHRNYADKRLLGEWFAPDTTGVKEITKLISDRANLLLDSTGSNPFLDKNLVLAKQE